MIISTIDVEINSLKYNIEIDIGTTGKCLSIENNEWQAQVNEMCHLRRSFVSNSSESEIRKIQFFSEPIAGASHNATAK
jgi:hypothetical protein